MRNDLLAGTVFEGTTLDLVKFLTLPRCVGKWQDGPAGCLLTNFYKALGLIKDGEVLDERVRFTYNENLNKVALGCLSNIPSIAYAMKFGDSIIPSIIEKSLMAAIVHAYDTGKETEAVNLLWDFIEAVGWATKAEVEQIADEELTKHYCFQ